MIDFYEVGEGTEAVEFNYTLPDQPSKLKDVVGACISVVDDAPLFSASMSPDLHGYEKIVGVRFIGKKTALSVSMPCGEVVSYKEFRDIPTVTTFCPCGDPRHIIVEYLKKPD